MKWLFKMDRFAGIDVFMHFSFLLLISWVALVHWRLGQSLTAAMVGVFVILVVFMCVVLHELGHAMMASRYGIKTRDIILLPIGDVARLEKLPTHPIQEMWVVLAGPAVNIVIVSALFAYMRVTASLKPLQTLTITTGPFLDWILAVNIFMIVFNMIPIFRWMVVACCAPCWPSGRNMAVRLRSRHLSDRALQFSLAL